jgi:hypothetical protein
MRAVIIRYWFLLLVRIAVKILRGGSGATHKAGEEVYEGQSTDNDDD